MSISEDQYHHINTRDRRSCKCERGINTKKVISMLDLIRGNTSQLINDIYYHL